VGNRKTQPAAESSTDCRPRERGKGRGTKRREAIGRVGWLPLSPDYLEQSRRPLVSLAFIVPLLATYEGGILCLGPAALRNGADVWLRYLLSLVGLGQYFLLPLLTVALLLAWHHVRNERWRLRREIVLGMYLECVVLAFGLLGLGYLERNLSQLALAVLHPSVAPSGGEQQLEPRGHFAPAMAPRRSSAPQRVGTSGTAPRAALLATVVSTPAARLVGFCGAGIYEEALFRLMLLPPVVGVLRLFGMPRAWRLTLSVLATSVIFSAAHYVGPQGEALDWFSASFRCFAGIFFATLFVHRGFGIAAGTHAVYDVLVGLA